METTSSMSELITIGVVHQLLNRVACLLFGGGGTSKSSHCRVPLCPYRDALLQMTPKRALKRFNPKLLLRRRGGVRASPHSARAETKLQESSRKSINTPQPPNIGFSQCSVVNSTMEVFYIRGSDVVNLGAIM